MPTPGRNLHIDNIKAILIFLVVFGHLIEPHIEKDSAIKSVWFFIYSFHMPMFALVSGMFSKPLLSEGQSRRLIKNIVVPLVAFEFLYEWTEILITGNPSNYFFLMAPYWMLWYLVSLLCWRLMISIFSRMRFPVLVAIAISITASYSAETGYFLGISRTLSFFPFFLLGWKSAQSMQSPQQANPLLSFTGAKMRALCLAILVAALAAAFLFHDWDHRWLYGSYSLASLHMANPTGVMLQLGLYAASALIGLSFLNIVTRRDIGIAWIGEHSMYSYLWHGFAVIALSTSGALEAIFRLNGITAMVILALISVAILKIASHPAWIALTDRCIFDPLVKLLLKKPAESRALLPRA